MITCLELKLALQCALAHVATPFCPRSDLQAVLLDFAAPGCLSVVSTNGRRLAVVELGIAHGQPAGTQFVMSAAEAECLRLGLDKHPHHATATLAIVGPLMVVYGGMVQTIEPVEIEYPRYLKILKPLGHTAPEFVCFNPQYLVAAIESVRGLMDPEKPAMALYPQQNNACLFTPQLIESLQYISKVTIAVMPMVQG